MSRKYKLTDETKEFNGIVLYRIQALKSFGVVREGDLGGWVEKESNLSQDGNAWIFGDAEVYGDAEVSGNAMVFGDTEIYSKAEIWAR